MNYDSGSGSGTEFGYNITCNKKVKKITNERPTFWENKMLLTLKRQVFWQFFHVLKTVLNIVWIRSRNKKFSKAGITTNLYGSRTLCKNLDKKYKVPIELKLPYVFIHP
jgi:hypothetical protein